MENGKRKPGRPPKHLGLAPPLRKVSDGNTLREMRQEAFGPKGPLLPDAPAEPLSGNGTLRVFAATDDFDGGRGQSEAQQASLPDAPGRIGEVADLKLSDLLKKLLDEVAHAEHQDRPGGKMLVKEALARLLIERALDGNQFALEAVLDRVEGKAVRGQAAAQVDNAIEDQIDRAAVASLNALVPTETPDVP